ncbi:MAG: hypothetical protein ACKOZY_04630, partial [Flavobacteriales bacterium]
KPICITRLFDAHHRSIGDLPRWLRHEDTRRKPDGEAGYHPANTTRQEECRMPMHGTKVEATVAGFSKAIPRF